MAANDSGDVARMPVIEMPTTSSRPAVDDPAADASGQNSDASGQNSASGHHSASGQNSDASGQNSDSGADLEAFVVANHQSLVRYLQRQTGDAASAQDLAHDAFEKLVERWADVSTMEHPERWLRTVARHLVVSRWRKSVTTSRTVEALGVVETRRSQSDGTGMLDLIDLIERLPERQRRVVLLRHRCQLSVEETARLLDWSPGTVKSTSWRALRSLRLHAG